MDIIINNPFPILGAFSNASAKDIIANVSKAKAYLKVGKSITFESDLLTLLPTIERTNESIERAQAKINQANDRLLYGLFWFIKDSPVDEIAIGHLAAGNVQKSKEIFEKKATYSSLLNLGVLALIEENLPAALNFYLTLINSERHRKDYVENVCNGNRISIPKDSLLSSLFDTLLLEYSALDILEALDGIDAQDAVAYVREKAITSLTATINAAVTTAKNAEKDPAIQYNAAVKLVRDTKDPFETLKSLSPDKDVFGMVADNLAKQVLQNAIYYYNNTAEYSKAKKAFKLQNYALSIAVGRLTKERCQENVNILLKAIDALPPESLQKEASAIQSRLRAFNQNRSDKAFCKNLDNVVSLIENCAPYLAAIKEVQGPDGTYYRRISSLIEETALSVTIGTVNDSLKELNEGDAITKFHARNSIKSVLESAWRATKYMEALDLTKESQERLSSQKSALSNLMDQALVCKDNRSVFKLETDSEIYSRCKTKQDYQAYLRRLPDGKHITEAQRKVSEIEAQEIALRQQLLKEIDSATTSQQAIALKSKCRESSLKKKLDDKCFALCKSKSDYREYLKAFGTTAVHSKEANSHLKLDNWFKSVWDTIKEHKGWSITISVVLILTVCVGLIWGPIGYSRMLYVIAVLSGIIAYGALTDRSGDSGCGLVLIGAAIAAICGFGGYAIDEAQKEKKKNAEAETVFYSMGSNPSEDECTSFLRKYPNSKHHDEVMQSYFHIVEKKGVSSLNDFANKYSYNKWGKQAADRVSQMCDSLYLLADSKGTIDAWRNYRSTVPSSYYKDSQTKIEEIENQSWNTESMAWKQASKENTISAYQKYLDLYSNGAHKSSAEKKIIDLQVASVYAGEHGELPSMDRIGYGGGASSTISVYNNTAYTLTLLYSGPDSKRLTIPSHQTGNVTLKNGYYRIAASVSAAGVRSFAGSENLNGGSYSVEYYIVTSRY